MPPGSPKKNQSSPPQRDHRHWFDLPDIAPPKKRRNRFRTLSSVGLIGTVMLLILAFVRGSP
jgi:hypothetical protein